MSYAKEYLPIFLFSIVILVLVTPAFGQEREITAKEFWAVQDVPLEKLRGKSCRMVSLGETFYGSKPVTTKFTADMILPDKMHMIIETTAKNTFLPRETFTAKGWTYERKTDGTWKREPFHDTSPREAANDLRKFARELAGGTYKKPDYKYQFVERSMVDGELLSLYEMVKVNLAPGDLRYFNRVWIDDNGFRIKGLSETTDEKGVLQSRQTTTYDYKTPIIIEVPKIPSKRKSLRK